MYSTARFFYLEDGNELTIHAGEGEGPAEPVAPEVVSGSTMQLVQHVDFESHPAESPGQKPVSPTKTG